MSFQSLDDIFRVITEKPEWELYRQHCHLVNSWHQVVNDNISRQTRVLYISRRVLWVATSSAVWAQNLMMQRHELLKKLNPLLPEPLIDIRFSSAHWHNLKELPTAETVSGQNFTGHPSDISDLIYPAVDAPSADAFRAWIAQRRWYLENLPICPQCLAPTPKGELARWSVCVICTQNF
jgi:predicted nucleic acid-binding Zn ribbon protein